MKFLSPVLVRFLRVRKKSFSSTHPLFVDDRTHMVDLGVSTEASGPSYPALPPEASSHSASVPGVNPQEQTQQNQTSPMDLGPERTEGEV